MHKQIFPQYVLIQTSIEKHGQKDRQVKYRIGLMYSDIKVSEDRNFEFCQQQKPLYLLLVQLSNQFNVLNPLMIFLFPKLYEHTF